MLSNASLQSSIQIHCKKILDNIAPENQTEFKLDDIIRIEKYAQTRNLIFALLYLHWLKESKSLANPFFDYKQENVQKAKNKMLEALSDAIKMDRKTFESLLTDAIWLTVWLSSDRRAFLGDLFYYVPESGITGEEFAELQKYLIYLSSPLEKTFLAAAEKEVVSLTFLEDELEANEGPKSQEIFNELISLELPFLTKAEPIQPEPKSNKPVFGKSFEEVIQQIPVLKEYDGSKKIEEQTYTPRNLQDGDRDRDEQELKERPNIVEPLAASDNFEEEIEENIELATEQVDLQDYESIDEALIEVQEPEILSQDPSEDVITEEPIEQSFDLIKPVEQEPANEKDDTKVQEEVEKTVEAEDDDKEYLSDMDLETHSKADHLELTKSVHTNPEEQKEPEPEPASEDPEVEDQPKTLLDQIMRSNKKERGTLNLQDRFRFRKRLFKNNEIDFDRALKIIKSSDTSKEALSRLNMLYGKAYDWDHDSEIYQEFSTSISKAIGN
jgi:hypothetical protein